MSAWIMVRLGAAIAAAATLTGKRFGLLVASSVVATSAIVAAAATNQPEASPLASILGHSLAADRTPVATIEPTAEPEAEEEPAEAVGNESTPAPEPSVTPEAEPEPVFIPEETAPEPAPEPETEPKKNRRKKPKPRRRRRKPADQTRLRRLPGQLRLPRGLRHRERDAILSGTLPPRHAAQQLLEVLDQATTPNGIAAISGQPPNKATKEGCPVFESFPSTSTTTKAGIVTGDGCAYPVEVQNLGDPVRNGPVHLARLHRRHGQPDHRRTGKLRLPGDRTGSPVVGGYSSQLNPSPLPLAARPRRLLDQRRADHRAEEGPEERKEDAELLLHLPRPLLGRGRGAVPGRGADRRRGRRPLARRSGAADRRIAGLQERRAADHHLRRRQPAGSGRAGRRRSR